MLRAKISTELRIWLMFNELFTGQEESKLCSRDIPPSVNQVSEYNSAINTNDEKQLSTDGIANIEKIDTSTDTSMITTIALMHEDVENMTVDNQTTDSNENITTLSESMDKMIGNGNETINSNEPASKRRSVSRSYENKNIRIHYE